MKRSRCVFIFGLLLLLITGIGYRGYSNHRVCIRNERLLSSCSPQFRADVQSLFEEMKERGYSVRIKEAWRDPKSQRRAFILGKSEVPLGRHNELDSRGQPASSAIDVEPNSSFENAERRFELQLACSAHAHGLETGIEWGLSGKRRDEVRAIVLNCRDDGGSLGWDPLHVQLTRASTP